MLHRDICTAQVPYRQAAWPVRSAELQWTRLVSANSAYVPTHPAQLRRQTFESCAGAALLGQTMDIMVAGVNKRCRVLRVRKVGNDLSLRYELHVLGSDHESVDVLGSGRHVRRPTVSTGGLANQPPPKTGIIWASLSLEESSAVVASDVETGGVAAPLIPLESSRSASATPRTAASGAGRHSQYHQQAPSLLGYISGTASRKYWQGQTSDYYARRGTGYWR